jgi:hypothetical protein
MAENAVGASHWEKGSQMRKAMFIAGVAVGFIAGARAGRDTYDKMVAYARQVAEHPKVQQATSTVQAKTTDLTKQAAAKAPDYAKGAMSSMQTTVSKWRSGSSTATADPAADGMLSGQPDDVGPDGNLVYPADDGSATAGHGRVTPDTP